ncbi:hypothetical protein OQ968_03550 [Mycobacterium sp. 663a-19]|uniref:hypothetical protein n=1 Tax=Mycobacterium sp. 663a-19 TaxID=2986148 RepID=UPI002D1F1B33|nr:hypothetical protein [Mycobacterium sp. 663a-19]MEB3980335.1 hypothetical protein [Mycobacterium sp. 663a-19]
MTLLAAAVGVLHGALGTPLLLTAGRSPAEIRREGSFAVTTALLVSPVIGGVMWAVKGQAPQLPATLIIIATPIVLVLDVLRYVAVAQGRPHVATRWSGMWLAGSAALPVATWLRLPVATTSHLIGAWTALALVALTGMLAAVRTGPRLHGYPAWISDGWQRRARYGMDSGVGQLGLFAVLLFATVVLNPDVTAALRGATALLAPVAVAACAVSSSAIPRTPPRRAWSSSARTASIATSATILVGATLFLLPGKVGELVLGPTFKEAQAIIPIVALDNAMAAWVIAVTMQLRAVHRSADALRLRLGYAVVALAAALGGGLQFRTAAGIAVGIATATTFITALALVRYRPWAEPAAGRRGAAVEFVTGQDFLKVGAPRPMPLATGLRLRESTPVDGALITLWSFAALAVFIPAAIIRFSGIPTDRTWLWLIPTITISAARLAWLIGNGERRLFETTFWLFSCIFMGLTPLAQVRENEWPYTDPHIDSTLVVPAVMIVLVGFGAFLAGAGLDNVRWPQRRWHAARRTRPNQDFTINYPRTVLLVVFAVLVDMYYLSRVGWLQFLMSRADLLAAYDAAWPRLSPGVVMMPLTHMALLVAFIALMRFRREANKARARGEDISSTVMRSNMALIVLIGILLADTMNPISNARYLSGTAILAAATAFGLFATRRRFRVAVCGLLFGMLIVFPVYSNAFRYTTHAEIELENPVKALLSPDYDSFDQLMNGYLVTAREGNVPGKQFMGVLLFWVPRAVWGDKPVDTGVYIANERGYSFTNLSAPLWIEFYMNGGWVPLAIGMFALGFGLHRWDTRLNASFDVDRMPSLIGCILPFYLLILLRGSLLQATSFVFFILVFSFFVRQRKNVKIRPRAPAARPEPPPASRVLQPGASYVPA